MSINSIRLGAIVCVVKLAAVELSVWIGDFGWGQFISVRVFHNGTIALAVTKSPRSLDLAVEDMTNLMICVIMRIGPLR